MSSQSPEGKWLYVSILIRAWRPVGGEKGAWSGEIYYLQGGRRWTFDDWFSLTARLQAIFRAAEVLTKRE